MVDIHSHISPHLDDGADGVEEALLMLNNAFETLLEKKNEAKIPIEIYIGAEHFGVTDIGRIAGENMLVPINNSRYVLVEFDFTDDIHRVS